MNKKLITLDLIKTLLPQRKIDAHKGEVGKVLIIAGSPGMTGAAILSARAAMRCGCGYVILALPSSLRNFVDPIVPEVITKALPETKEGCLSEHAFDEVVILSQNVDAVAVGPGISTSISTAKLLRKLIDYWKKKEQKVVFDADALNINASINNFPKVFTSQNNFVFTPHIGELSRLIEIPSDRIKNNRERFIESFAAENKIVSVLKGAKTIVCDRDGKFLINSTGNPGMASAGMGDVLTGMITSFISQGLSLFNASCTGVYLHGFAGDIIYKEKSSGLIASDVVEAIPRALRLVEKLK